MLYCNIRSVLYYKNKRIITNYVANMLQAFMGFESVIIMLAKAETVLKI